MEKNKVTIKQLLARSIKDVSQISDTAKLDCELLLADIMAVSTTYLKTWPEAEVQPEQLTKYLSVVARRLDGEPIAHILKRKGFWDLELEVSPDTLIPRPDTEVLVEKALSLIPESEADVLDLGTGTGAIALALAKERPSWRVYATDLFDSVVALAQRNAKNNGVENCHIFQSDWFNNVGLETQTQFNLIVSNPPYISADDPHLEQGDVRFEPKSALVANEKGLLDIKTIAGNAVNFLHNGGWLMVEHGFEQSEQVQRIFTQCGYSNIESIIDYGGNLRATLGSWIR